MQKPNQVLDLLGALVELKTDLALIGDGLKRLKGVRPLRITKVMC